jgi:hypothetical protein
VFGTRGSYRCMLVEQKPLTAFEFRWVVLRVGCTAVVGILRTAACLSWEAHSRRFLTAYTFRGVVQHVANIAVETRRAAACPSSSWSAQQTPAEQTL